MKEFKEQKREISFYNGGVVVKTACYEKCSWLKVCVKNSFVFTQKVGCQVSLLVSMAEVDCVVPRRGDVRNSPQELTEVSIVETEQVKVELQLFKFSQKTLDRPLG